MDIEDKKWNTDEEVFDGVTDGEERQSVGEQVQEKRGKEKDDNWGHS